MNAQTEPPETADGIHDIFIIGGGINGCGIARDAAGRGLRVALAEMSDIGGATSSASTKLFHGGLRYLEFFEFKLVHESLVERETLLRAMPHIAWPMRFVLPYDPAMRFEAETPTSRVLSVVMPWMRGRRPAWLIRLGLILYDTMGGRKVLPRARSIRLPGTPEGAPLKDRFEHGFEYSDCWVQDSRLVILNARDAAARGALIMPHTRVMSAERSDGIWRIMLERDGETVPMQARVLVNAGGPWAGDIIHNVVHSNSTEDVRLVRGSHIVTRRLYDHDKCYFLQGPDGRIIFVIPYEDDFTLIGTTEAAHPDPSTEAVCTEDEKRYLTEFASRYFRVPIGIDDVVWTFSGVRPLYDDGAASATAATRDYVLKLDTAGGAPLLNIFGGKITTYRRLAEAAVDKLAGSFPDLSGDWTAGVALPGGDFPVTGAAALHADLCLRFPFLDPAWAWRLVRCYGTETAELLAGATDRADLGQDFGATVTARELDWVVDREWVRTGDDFLWRRTRQGLRVNPDEAAAIDAYIRDRHARTAAGRA